MKLLVVAVLLAVVQAPSPVPRKAADNAAGTRHPVKSDGNRNDGSTAPVPAPLKTNGSGEAKGDSSAPSGKNAGESITVTKLPPVTVTRDWSDWIYVGFSGLLVVVGFLQVWLLCRTRTVIRRQTDFMEGTLHVDGARVIEFREGRHPIFFVKIINSGMVAKDVSGSMEVKLYDLNSDSTMKYVCEQMVVIPAHGSRELFFPSDIQLNGNMLRDFEMGKMRLCISGQAKWGKQSHVKYCYKYNQWRLGNRPAELPDFVPCDFDTQKTRSVNVKAVGSSMTASAGNVTVTGENREPETPKEPPERN